MANIPILEWQLSSLARFGVKQAIVLSSTPVAEQYKDPLDRLQLHYLSSSAWTGEGDALRDLESRDGLCPVDDFVLVRACTISNINVAKLVAAHKRRRLADRNWLVTCVFRHSTGSTPKGITLAVDGHSGTLVKYVAAPPPDTDADEHVKGYGAMVIDVSAEHSGLQFGGEVDIYTDVLDVGLDVCAPEFLVEFRENFFFTHVRSYIQEKLDGGDAEVFGNRMYAHFTDSRRGEYAARISCLSTLVKTTSDVVNGWMAPIEPYRHLQLRQQYMHQSSQSQQQQQYQQQQQRTDGSPGGGGSETIGYISERSVIGEAVSIGMGSTIVESIVGDHVTIGSDVTINNCIISDGCVIGDRSDLTHSILDLDCRVQSDACIPRNCFLHDSVCVGRDVHPLDTCSFITLQDPTDMNSRYEHNKEKGEEDASLEKKELAEKTIESAEEETVGVFEKGGGVEKGGMEKESKRKSPKIFENEQHAGEGGRNDENETDITISEVNEVHENGVDPPEVTVVDEESPEESQGQLSEPIMTEEMKSSEIESTYTEIGVSADPGDIDDTMDMEFITRGIVIPASQARILDRFFCEREYSIVEYVSEGVDDLEVEEEDDVKGFDEEDTRAGGEENDVNGVQESMQKLAVGDDGLDKGGDEVERNQLAQFTQEVLETMERAFAENVDVSNTTTEIKSLKVAYDRSFSETVSRVAGCIALTIQKRFEQELETQLYGSIVSNLQRYNELISNFSEEGDLRHHKGVAQGLADLLRDHSTLLMYVFKEMQDKEMLDEDGILAWAKDEEKLVEFEERDSGLLTTLRPLLDWLEVDDEDESDGNDEEE